MSLKYKVRSNCYENYNGKNWISLEQMRATSYGWWPYLRRIGNMTVFNNGTYSNCTTKHQNQCLNLLRDNGINIDLMVHTVSHLDDLHGIWQEYKTEIKSLIRAIKKPRSRSTTNAKRLKRIMYLRQKMHEVKHLMRLDA